VETLSVSSSSHGESAKKISSLEAELARAHALIETLQSQQRAMSDDGDILNALQSNLQQQMNLKAEAENKARLSEKQVQELELNISQQAEELAKFQSLQENLQQQMTAKAEAENKARSAYDRIQQLESEKEQNVEDIKQLRKQVVEAREAMAAQHQELEKIRRERDEQQRKEMALTTRLNAAKKKEADKENAAEHLEDSLKTAQEELEVVKLEWKQAIAAKESIEKQFEQIKKSTGERVDHLESVLAEERRLNEERKVKMKAFVEKKAEELRQAKEDNDALQIELTQTNRSLVDLNTRWKQLHAQWVQAQTRNRELQRDLNRTKKDSENLHKQGDTLEMKLSRSANETEEHKNKRLAAKHELMSVLRALDAEREISARLRDKIKFSLTPKVLSQQQTLNESLDEFDAALLKLSTRLGKPLPPQPDNRDDSDSPEGNTTNLGSSSNPDTDTLVEKLEHETDHVSAAISTLSSNIERFRAILDASGERTCYTVISELITTGGMTGSPATQGERTAITGGLASRMQSHRYGQVGTSAEQL
jgi:chromosome segregation ATPase